MRIGMCLAGAGLALIAACTSAAAGGGVATATPPRGTTVAHSTAPAEPQPLRVVRWGVDDEMLSVLVENTTEQEIRSAHVVITARDDRGTIIATVSGPAGALCCTIVALPPHDTFGLFADFGDGVVRTAKVDVDYSKVSVGAPSSGAGDITSSAGQLDRRGDLTLVHTFLGSSANAGPYVAVQAVLVDRTGKQLVAVISGRFYCLFPGRQLGVTLQLFHPVPSGTRIQSIRTFAIPADLAAVTTALPRCAAD